MSDNTDEEDYAILKTQISEMEAAGTIGDQSVYTTGTWAAYIFAGE